MKDVKNKNKKIIHYNHYPIVAAVVFSLLSFTILAVSFPLMLFAQEVSQPSQADVPSVEIKEPIVKPAEPQPVSDDNFITPLPQPIDKEEGPVDPHEIKNALQQIRDIQVEIKRFQKALKGLKGGEEILATVNELMTQATDYANGIKNASGENQREALQDFYDARLWDSVNEIRNQFVDPKEIKDVLRQLKQIQTELKRFQKQVAKISGSDNIQQLISELSAKAVAFVESITKAPLEEQRDALQEFYDAQIWDSINQIRARVELPKELKNIARDLKIIQKMPKQKTYQKTGVDLEKLQANIDKIAGIYDQIKSAMDEGDWDGAWEIIEEEMHRGGLHPGEVRHTMDRLREVRDRLRFIKDSDIKAQVEQILESIIETFNDGDFREAREAVDQFLDQAQLMEKYFQRYIYGQKEGEDEKMMEMMDKLEGLVKERLEKGGMEEKK